MKPRTESHARVQRQNHVAGERPVAAPRGANDHAPPDSQHREMALPRLGPVFLANEARLQLADGPQSEGLEVAQGSRSSADGGLDVRRIAAGQVSPHDRRFGRIHDRAESLVGETEARLDARATGREAGQYLADGLDGLDVGGDRQLNPNPRALGPGVWVELSVAA